MEPILINQAELITLIVTYFLTAVVALPLLIWGFGSKNTDWGKFTKVWFSLVVILVIVGVIMILRPQAFYDILIKIKTAIGL